MEAVPHHELLGIAALDEVGLLEQAGLDLKGLRHVVLDARPAGGLEVLDVEEGGVGPALDGQVVVELLLHDDARPGHEHGAVGAGAQGQVVVGLLAAVAHARVHADELLGVLHGLDGAAAGVVVVGLGLVGTPLHVHERPVLDRHEVEAGAGGEAAHHAARALADLGRADVVHAAERAHERAGGQAVHTAGAAHGGQPLPAPLLRDLAELGGDGVERLVPGDADPAGVGVALGVGALQRVAQAVGVVGGLERRLALGAAVAIGLLCALVALDLHRATVLHGDPHAALHLAAAAAAGADALDLALGRRFGARRGESDAGSCRQAGSNRRGSREFRERATG